MRRVPTRFRYREAWLDGHRGSLTLTRSPLFLRFVLDAGGGLDALDQQEDEPTADEAVVVGRRVSADPEHVTVGGRRRGFWRLLVKYVRVEPQPPDEVVRDRAKWQAWCYQQQAKENNDAGAPADAG